MAHKIPTFKKKLFILFTFFLMTPLLAQEHGDHYKKGSLENHPMKRVENHQMHGMEQDSMQNHQGMMMGKSLVLNRRGSGTGWLPDVAPLPPVCNWW
ncbi:MAG TPA: hypothetical protein VFM65_05635 [Flavobacteriaceae bacterium]|nr:hypothetical protein [Flavobacteriaceae bacterium]